MWLWGRYGESDGRGGCEVFLFFVRLFDLCFLCFGGEEIVCGVFIWGDGIVLSVLGDYLKGDCEDLKGRL